MLLQNIESELLSDLSADQQELVAGGVDFSFSNSLYQVRIAQVGSTSISGPGGTNTQSVGAVQQIGTAGSTLTGLGALGVIVPALPIPAPLR